MSRSAQYLGYLEQGHEVAGAGWALDREAVSVVRAKAQERGIEEEVYRHPLRASPVGVAAEHSAVGVAGEVADEMLLSAHVELKRMLAVVEREGANSVGTKEFFFVQHAGENSSQLRFVHGRKQSSSGYSFCAGHVQIRGELRVPVINSLALLAKLGSLARMSSSKSAMVVSRALARRIHAPNVQRQHGKPKGLWCGYLGASCVCDGSSVASGVEVWLRSAVPWRGSVSVRRAPSDRVRSGMS